MAVVETNHQHQKNLHALRVLVAHAERGELVIEKIERETNVALGFILTTDEQAIMLTLRPTGYIGPIDKPDEKTVLEATETPDPGERHDEDDRFDGI